MLFVVDIQGDDGGVGRVAAAEGDIPFARSQVDCPRGLGWKVTHAGVNIVGPLGRHPVGNSTIVKVPSSCIGRPPKTFAWVELFSGIEETLRWIGGTGTGLEDNFAGTSSFGVGLHCSCLVEGCCRLLWVAVGCCGLLYQVKENNARR